jgi:hypothetical protein
MVVFGDARPETRMKKRTGEAPSRADAPRRTIGAIALALVGLTPLVACGNDDGGDRAAETTTTTSAAVTTTSPPEGTPRPRVAAPSNLGFETALADGGALDWWRSDMPDYTLEVVDVPARSGAHSAHIVRSTPLDVEDEDSDWASFDQYLDLHDGARQNIRLKAWIKTKGADTCAGCEKAGGIASTDESRRGAEVRLLVYDGPTPLEYTVLTPLVTGTRDWTLFEATAVVPEGADDLIVSAVLWGGGEAWFDDLEITIG